MLAFTNRDLNVFFTKKTTYFFVFLAILHVVVWSSFLNFYNYHCGIAYTAYDPAIQYRNLSEAEDWEKIDIAQTAVQFSPQPALSQKIDSLITQDIYEHLISETLDENFLQAKGFTIVKNRATRVIRHADLPGWLLKIGAHASRQLPMDSTVKNFLAETSGNPCRLMPVLNSNLLRAAGRDYFIKRLAELPASERDFFNFPNEYIYASPHAKQNAPLHHRFFSLSEYKEVYSGEETLSIIEAQDSNTQRALARKISNFIKKTSVHDWHKENVVLSKEAGRWCFENIDNEPTGILIDQQDTGAHLFHREEHVLVGLIAFRDNYCRKHGLTAMAIEIDSEIVDYLKARPELNERTNKQLAFVDPLPDTLFQDVCKWVLIVISVICPLLPLIFLIGALLSTYCSKEKQHPYYSIEDNTPGRIAFA